MHSSTQASRGCSGTWLWTKSVQTSGSSPEAISRAARSRVASRSSSGSWGTVIAWRSTIGWNASTGPPELLIVRGAHATPEQTDDVVARLAEAGAHAHVTAGKEATVIGAIG